MATFGTTDKGEDSWTVGQNVLVANLKEITEIGRLASISFYLYRVATGTAIKTKFALYTCVENGSSYPGDLLAYTDEVSYDGVNEWVTLKVRWHSNAQGLLQKGVYFVTMWSSGASFTVYGTAGTGGWRDKTSAYNGFPDPFPADPNVQLRTVSCYCTYLRIGQLKIYKKVKWKFGSYGLATTATLGALSLGSPDAETGWYAETYTPSTIEMFIIPKSAQRLALECGTYVNSDALGITNYVIDEGDRVADSLRNIYVVETVKEVVVGDAYDHTECSLKKLPFEA